jgi:asparagine N-glycosylation enzyme membrane subunit Stt3
MAAAVMAVAFSLSNRRARVVPQWTLVLSALLAIAGLGSIFTAWIGFMVLPLWGVVMGVCLLATKDPVAVDPSREPAAV